MLHGGWYVFGVSPLRAGDSLWERHLRGAPVEMTELGDFEQSEIWSRWLLAPDFLRVYLWPSLS